MKNKLNYLSLIALLFSLQGNAQYTERRNALSLFTNKISELYSLHKTADFTTYKSGQLDMHRNTEFPIFIELQQGTWYQFIVVGDPNAKKIEMKLGIEGVGEIITDKFKPQNTNEYWTHFSFVCPRSGRYLLTLFQRGSHENMLAHVSILQRLNRTKDAVLSFKH